MKSINCLRAICMYMKYTIWTPDKSFRFSLTEDQVDELYKWANLAESGDIRELCSILTMTYIEKGNRSYIRCTFPKYVPPIYLPVPSFEVMFTTDNCFEMRGSSNFTESNSSLNDYY